MKKNQVSHFEIYADDPDRLQQFYTSLFDWKVEPVPGMDYRMITTAETDAQGHALPPGGINGGMLKRPSGYGVNAPVAYVNVESVNAAVDRAKSLGARLTKEKTPVPGMGWFAMLMDPQGNHFAVWEPDKQAK